MIYLSYDIFKIFLCISLNNCRYNNNNIFFEYNDVR